MEVVCDDILQTNMDQILFLKTGLTRTILLLFVVMLASGADTQLYTYLTVPSCLSHGRLNLFSQAGKQKSNSAHQSVGVS